MSYCPKCKGKISENESSCPHCGKRVFMGDQLETISTRTTPWQKCVIAVSIVILIAIGFTFQGAREREDKAAQNNFTGPVSQIVNTAAAHSGLARDFGQPVHTLKADPKSAVIEIIFPRGPLSSMQASLVAQAVCGATSRAYVQKGYMARHITVSIFSRMPNGKKMLYGKAIYNGNLDKMSWLPAGQI